MAPPPENRHQYRGEIEVEMNNGTGNGMHFRDFVPVEISPTPNGNYRTGPTIESMPSEPSHDHDHRRPPRFVRFMKWLEQPMNLALFLWLIPVVSGLIMQLLLMTGALDHATKTKERKKIWTEVVNQILNAFFTLGCFFSHTEVFYHLLFAIRWRPEDEVSIRSIYCKNRTPNPRDRRHLLFVVCLINLTWVGQYIMCGLYWAFNRHNRPSGFLTLWMVITLVAPILAYFYTAKGPLKADKIEEGGQPIQPIETPESKLKMYNGGVMVTRPEWDGGLFGCCDDTTVGCSAFFCPFYAFGKNMNKLGFGPRNLHIVTFVIAVITPFVVFYITSLKIHSHAIKIVLWTTGGLLSWVGFLYGGYWRIRMREKYNLPENSFCFGVPFLTDYFQWLFCAPCSLAQEIRTANSYDIEDASDEMVSQIPREVSMRRFESNRSFSSPPKFGPADALHSRQGSVDDRPIEMSAFGRSSTASRVHAMAPPHPPAM